MSASDETLESGGPVKATGSRYPWWTFAVLPYTRLNLPGTGRLCRLIKLSGGPGNAPDWRGAPVKQVRSKSHRYQMICNLAVWTERMTFFLGEFPEPDLVAVLRTGVQPNDTFIDGGSNVGLVSLLAAARVGQYGHVHAIDPNPVNTARLHEMLAANQIGNITVHGLALGDVETVTNLNLFSDLNTETGTLAMPHRGVSAVVKSIPVRVVRGDDVLLDAVKAPLFVKLDVEGYECRAIDGLRETIARYRPAVLTECIPQHLERAGASVDALCDLMQSLSYAGYLIAAERSLRGMRLRLSPLTQGLKQRLMRQIGANVLWLTSDGVYAQRFSQYITS